MTSVLCGFNQVKVMSSLENISEIKGFDSFIKIEPINKGWSEDKKYYIETRDNRRLLLRIAQISEYDRKKAEFEIMRQIFTLDIPMNEPLDFGLCNGGENAYSLFTWCDGEDAQSILPMLTETEQYVLGLKAGELLRKIHSVSAPLSTENWSDYYNRKIDTRLEKFLACGIIFEGDNKLIEYVKSNRKLLDNRPQCLQHGDYHVGNMVITPAGELSIIDFNRVSYGDPWEEFNRIVWSADASPYFATGMLNGYFKGRPGDEFFRLMAFYIGANTIGSLPWAIPFGQAEIDTMLKQAADVLSWFDNMKNPVPTWYLEDFYIQYINNIPYKLKSFFDFSFIEQYGRVFKVFDDQDSGNVCFGVQNGDEKYFIKFAGAPTQRAVCPPEEAIQNLKAALPAYKYLAHENLIKLVRHEEVGGGYAAIFKWAEGECMGRMYPKSSAKFTAMPLEAKLAVFEDILLFHAHVHEKGYVAIDFYDGSVLYDIEKNKTKICDIDFYSKKPYINRMGRLWGSAKYMAPEEFILGAEIDEITNVYTMGALAFALFAKYDRTQEMWPLSDTLYEIVKKATNDKRELRQNSIEQLINQWRAGVLEMKKFHKN